MRFARTFAVLFTVAFALALAPGAGAAPASFDPPAYYGIPGPAPSADIYGIDIGDLNSDGRPDIVTANRHGDDLGILLNTGGGVFAPAPNLPLGAESKPEVVAIG